ncbi:electrogenic aspartate/glutamate antiporter SLC25A13, mitochondrial-like [Clytia hemisphaerica]|uniref:EF-hand domain-containing protein n=1 Tax=Clytia hemisphaerica TaxID=252671 RepID=A0A7M5UYN6_9CNID|eukprot:TCONS_00016381-protein
MDWWQSLFSRARCAKAPLYDYAVKRANPQDLRVIFYKYASVEKNGERYLRPTDLIRDLLNMDAATHNADTLSLLSGVVDQTKDGLISFEEFQAFEALLCNVDAKYRLCFQMFDLDGKGTITFDEFKKMLSCQTTYAKYPFNFDCDFVRFYFGKDLKYKVNYQEFTHLLQHLNKEYIKQLFRQKAGKNQLISTLQFAEIMKVGCPHKLTPYIVDNMMAAVTAQSGSRTVSYIYCMAFYDMLQNLSVIQLLFKDAADNNKFTGLTREELLQASVRYPAVSPLQLEILFDICTVANTGKGKISTIDLQPLQPQRDPMTVFSKIHEFKHYERMPGETGTEKVEQQWYMKVAQSGYKFFLGSLAGATGAAFVYPIDLVKTRMQNQRSVLPGERLYQNSFDCFRKVIKNEGPTGLYRGLVPQLIGVSPEKAIKLTTNDLVRYKFTDKDGEIRLIGEIIAGGCGGGAQVMFTNPIEIVKIRMQVAGESGTQTSALKLVKELGFSGLYKGARACFLRDIPFSSIYFPCYAHFKSGLADKNGYNSPISLLLAAAAAGVPAAYLVTPADVIKTRLQVKARRGQQTYRGVIDCARKILQEEGATAFFKGGPARVFRSSPQFGVTLMTYELLQRVLYVDFGGGYTRTELTPRNPEVSLHPDHIGGLRLAVASFSGIETKFGLMLPKFSPPPPSSENPVITSGK